MRFDNATIPEIADEYVLGLLDRAEQQALEQESERNPALRTAIAASQERYLPLDLTVELVDVPVGLWARIEAGLSDGDAAVPLGGATLAPEAALTAAANDNRRAGWRAAALSSMAASLVLAVALTWSLGRHADPVVIAVLLNEAGEVQAVVEDFGNDTAQIRLLADIRVPADKAVEVWTLPSQETGPVSLGLLEDGRHHAWKGRHFPCRRLRSSTRSRCRMPEVRRPVVRPDRFSPRDLRNRPIVQPRRLA
ncbi:anti-sigma-K factor RskA [Pseudorhizobium tarimense]|uniref:Anti-sigma-K factor RskA n=1 Tax=Pseudorhizobium tarimense TaxID=1079109 RepID=A0ABV2HDN9_9HYPH|nr:anti-sigma factor [Pseudorhizobium tarimense]